MRARTLPRYLPLAALVFALPACSGGGGGGDDDDDGEYVEVGRVEVTLLVPPAVAGQDPFEDVTTLHVEIRDAGGAVLVEGDFGVNDPMEIRSIPAGTGRVIVLEGRDALDAPVSRGRTLGIDVVEGATVPSSLYFSKIGAFATVYGSPAARTGAATWTFSDGRVLIAGGLDGGGSALASAELFDWETDSVIPAGTMTSSLGLAFPAVASLGNDTLLLAGGITASAGTPTDVAHVYTHVADGVGTWAASIPPLTGGARREHGAAGLGPGRALLAGGSATTSATGPALDTTLVFTWTGTAGAWTAGPDMQEPRMGAIVLPASGDTAIIAGGYNMNVSGGNDDFSDDIDIMSLNGGNVVLAGGNPQLGPSRGWAGAAAVGADQWLVWGGEEGDNNGHGLTDIVELWTWTGTALTFSTRQDFPDVQRGGAGGILAGNQVLLLGGNADEYPTSTPRNTAVVYDIAGDSYTDLPASPGPTLGGTAAPLPDGTSLVVIDGAVLRFNPL